jgi:cyclophilin family peptidyl-prolyl cis-trans isomerase
VRYVLYPDAAPMAVYNFVGLARSGYYDNTTIWRSEYGFAVQGGDATGTGTGGSTIWSNNPYPPEASADLKHYAGALCAAFAAGGDVTGGNSQFYFVTALPDSVSSSDRQAELTANGYTDAQIDMSELKRLHDIWTARGETLDNVFDLTTVRSALEVCLAAGMADLTLADGLAFSKNTITAQVMQKVGPARVADLARAMGVRQSPLEAVPSLALGTSPVTLREMVAAYNTIANAGRYVEPILIASIEDRHGKVLQTFAPPAPEQAMPLQAAQTLRNAMRGTIDRGTGSALRSRYGLRADLAGKTGTTQDNTDGWFIALHPRVVAGAWVGFNDGRITLRSDYWGQGAHSALPMVGDFLQQAFRTNTLDGRDRFVDEETPSLLGDAMNGGSG